MGRCESCGEWFVGHGSLCPWCILHISTAKHINQVKVAIRANKI